MAKGDVPYWGSEGPPDNLPPGFALGDKKNKVPETEIVFPETGEDDKWNLDRKDSPTVLQNELIKGGGMEPIRPDAEVERSMEYEEEDKPEAFFRNYLRMLNDEKNPLKYEIPQYSTSDKSRVGIILEQRLEEGLFDSRITRHNTNENGQGMFSNYEIVGTIFDSTQDGIEDSELARAFIDDEIARLKEKIEKQLAEIEGLEVSEKQAVEKEIETISKSREELALAFEIDLAEVRTLSQIGEKSKKAKINDALIGLGKALRELNNLKEENESENPLIIKDRQKVENLRSLRENIQISEKEEREIERYKFYLPNIQYNEERGTLLAEKRKTYEDRAERDGTDLDSVARSEIMNELFKGLVNTKEIAEKMESDGKLRTIEDWRIFYDAAMIINEYSQGDLEKLRKVEQ